MVPQHSAPPLQAHLSIPRPGGSHPALVLQFYILQFSISRNFVLQLRLLADIGAVIFLRSYYWPYGVIYIARKDKPVNLLLFVYLLPDQHLRSLKLFSSICLSSGFNLN